LKRRVTDCVVGWVGALLLLPPPQAVRRSAPKQAKEAKRPEGRREERESFMMMGQFEEGVQALPETKRFMVAAGGGRCGEQSAASHLGLDCATVLAKKS
jgi:hypothetical protein